MADNRVIVGASVDDKVSGPLDRIKDKFNTLGKSAAGQGVIIGASAKVMGSAMGLVDRALSGTIDFIHDGIQAASDLNETINKSAVVFGDSASKVETFGDSAAKSLGQSKEQAIAAAASFGNLFNTIGVGKPKAADMSVTMVKLASDLASFNNIDPTEALAKLQSGLVGEAKPLRELGILLSETQVKAKAMEMGFKPVNGELSEGAKLQARYALILEQSTTAQGDFARTADQLANSQRIANAELRDAQAVLGEKLLPAQLAVTKAEGSFFDGLNALGDLLSGKDTPEAAAFARALGLVDDKTVAAVISADRHRKALEYMATAAKDDAIPATKDLTGAQEKLASAFDKTKEAASHVDDAIKGLSDTLYGTTILTGDVAQAQKDLKDILDAGPASKGAEDQAIFAGKVAEARARLMELQGELAKTEGPQAFYDWTLKNIDATKGMDKALQDAAISLRAAALLSATVAPINFVKDYVDPLNRSTKPAGARAAGGPVSGGSPYLVGEKGPELFVPRQSGAIVPNGTGGHVTLNATFNVSGATNPQTFSREALQALRRELTRQGMSLA